MPLVVPSSDALDHSADTVVFKSPRSVRRTVSRPIFADTERELVPVDTVPFRFTNIGRPDAVFWAF